MAEITKIAWCRHTFNHVEGCSKVSPGCANCYAETRANRFGTVKWGPEGTRRVAAESYWKQPLKWNRQAEADLASWKRAAAGARSEYDMVEPYERPRVFCASLADVFEDWQGPMVDAQGRKLWTHEVTQGPLPDGITEERALRAGHRPLTMDDVRARLWNLIWDTPNLDWLLLTKRPENIHRMAGCNFCRGYQPVDPNYSTRCSCGGDRGFPPNVWLGATCEDRKHGVPRIDVLRNAPAAIRFLSVEPMLEDLGELNLDGIHQVIIGCESDGPRVGRLGTDSEQEWCSWALGLVAQCQRKGVAVFVKQVPGNGVVLHALGQFPKGLRVREFPKAVST